MPDKKMPFLQKNPQDKWCELEFWSLCNWTLKSYLRPHWGYFIFGSLILFSLHNLFELSIHLDTHIWFVSTLLKLWCWFINEWIKIVNVELIWKPLFVFLYRLIRSFIGDIMEHGTFSMHPSMQYILRMFY